MSGVRSFSFPSIKFGVCVFGELFRYSRVGLPVKPLRRNVLSFRLFWKEDWKLGVDRSEEKVVRKVVLLSLLLPL